MTLKKSQVENLHSYLYSEYSNRLNKLETERINKILESDEYKTLYNKFETFYKEVGLDMTEWQIKDHTMIVLHGYKNRVDTWNIFDKMNNKIRAILSTLPQDTDFEDVVKLVEEKLQLDNIITEEHNQ